jgi:hypothetical protein
VRGGEAGAGEGGGAVVIGVEADAGAALGGLAAVLGSLRVSDDHGAAEPGTELGVGQFPRAGQDILLDLAGGVLVEDVGGLGDEPCPVGVDLPGGQGGTGGGEPPGEGDGLAGPPLGGAG